MKRASLLVDDASHRPQSASVASWYTPGLSDGLGDRLLMFDNTTASSLELLRFKPEFAHKPGFERALRRRVEDLASFAHPSIAKVRKVEWLRDGEGLALVSNHVDGRRLSEVIDKAVGPSFALELLRQLTPVLANLERQGPHFSHGTITPDRIVVTPEGRLVLTEHVVGPAIDALRLAPGRLRVELGLALPKRDGEIRLNSRVDVIQLAFIALAMLLGRRLNAAEYPEGGMKLLDELVQSSGYNTAAAPRLRHWLERALQLGGRTFSSAQDAHAALQELPEEKELLMAAPQRNVHAFQTPSEEAKAYPSEFPAEESHAIARHSPQALEEWRPATAAGADESQPAPPRRRRWLLPALGALAVVEAVVIVGLVLVTQGRVTLPGLAAGNVPPAQIATASSAPSVTPVVPAPGPATPAASLATGAPAASTATPESRTHGRLEVSADGPGARITVDGTSRGQAPLAIDLEPGPHTVVISDGRTTVSRTVTITAGSSSTVMAALGAAGSAAGWLSITSPVELQILEGGTLIGTTSAARVMLPAGKHELVLSSNSLGFQTTVSTDIRAGRTSTAAVTIPNGSLSLNALPWANVWVDGRAVGTTPVANLEVPLGTHDIIWRHPQLGERRQTTVVTAKAPVRLVMDLNK